MNRRKFMQFLGLGVPAAVAIAQIPDATEPPRWPPMAMPTVLDSSAMTTMPTVVEMSSMTSVFPVGLMMTRADLERYRQEHEDGND